MISVNPFFKNHPHLKIIHAHCTTFMILAKNKMYFTLVKKGRCVLWRLNDHMGGLRSSEFLKYEIDLGGYHISSLR